MTWSRTLQLSPQKFDKLTSTYGQILSDARQGLELENYIFNSLCVIFINKNLLIKILLKK
jgi:hypothetical protein